MANIEERVPLLAGPAVAVWYGFQNKEMETVEKLTLVLKITWITLQMAYMDAKIFLKCLLSSDYKEGMRIVRLEKEREHAEISKRRGG